MTNMPSVPTVVHWARKTLHPHAHSLPAVVPDNSHGRLAIVSIVSISIPARARYTRQGTKVSLREGPACAAQVRVRRRLVRHRRADDCNEKDDRELEASML